MNMIISKQGMLWIARRRDKHGPIWVLRKSGELLFVYRLGSTCPTRRFRVSCGLGRLGAVSAMAEEAGGAGQGEYKGGCRGPKGQGG